MTVPAPAGLEAKLIADAADARLDQMDLLSAALIASGVKDVDVAAEAKTVREAIAPAVARARGESGGAKRGATLLRALHDTVLRRYAAQSTALDEVVRTGEFNCLSSALLYVVAAEGLVDQPRAMVTRHHAYARVMVDGRVVDVETTSPAGFDAERAALLTPTFVKQIAGDDVSPTELLEDLKRPEELPVLSLVAAVYSNRAAGLVERGDLGGAAVALDRAARLGSGSLRARAADWRGNVLNAGVVELVKEERYDDARALLELALEGSDGETRRVLRANLATVLLRLAEQALARKDWTRALEHAARARDAGGSAVDVASVETRANAELAALEGSASRCRADGARPGTEQAREAAACLAELARTLRGNDVDAALQVARTAWRLVEADPSSVPAAPRALFYSLVGKARQMTAQGDCELVTMLVREAAPHRAALDGQAWSPDEEIGVCWAKEAGRLFEQRGWTEAARLYTRALAHRPQDAALRTNLARAELNQAIGLAGEGRCDEARPLARRAGRGEAELDEKATQLLESCASVRARRAAEKKDWGTAAEELRRGLLDAPASLPLREHLGATLHNLAASLLSRPRGSSCGEARALLPELEALGRTEAHAAIVRSCPDQERAAIENRR